MNKRPGGDRLERRIDARGGDLFVISQRQRRLMLALLVALAMVWLLPLYSLLTASLVGGGLSNYTYVLANPVNGMPFWRYFANSALIGGCAAALVVAVSAMAGFAFSKIEFAGREWVFNLVVMCLAVSAAVIYVPMFYVLKSLHLYNTYLAVILPQVTLTLPFGVLLMKNYFDALPTSLMESASIDGANPWQIFHDIYLPMARPALINLGVLQLMWSFQDFFLPLVLLTDKTLYPATIAISVFKGMFGAVGSELGYFNAALVIIGLPSVVIFIVAERFISRGITAGALKE